MTDTEAAGRPRGRRAGRRSDAKARPVGVVLTFVVALVAIGGVAAFFMSADLHVAELPERGPGGHVPRHRRWSTASACPTWP